VKIKLIVLVSLPLWALAIQSCKLKADDSADLVLSNARIYTVNAKDPWAESVAIKGDRIVYVGDAEGGEAFVGDATKRADLGGRFVMPGIIDGHTHPGMMNMESYGPSLPQSSHEDLLAAVKAYSDTVPGDGWIKLCCWSNFDYLKRDKNGPHKRDLDALVPDRPVWITSLTWHSYWLNSKGLEILGVDADTPDPSPGVATYVRDKNGELSGWVKEGAGWQFMAEHFPPDIKNLREGIDRSLSALSTYGVTTVYDGGNWDYEDEVYSYLAELDTLGKLPLRYEGTYVVYLPERRHIAVREMHRLQEAYGGERLKFRTIKLFMDGITPELASGLIEPFASHPNERGGTTLSVEELRDWLLELHKARFDLHVHTIGDLAVRKVLDAVEAAKKIVGESFYPRVTVAHLETIDPADWKRFGELDVTANFTPWWHGRAAGGELSPLLGEARFHRVFPARELIEAGANVTFSSDEWGEDSFTPFLGMQVGYNRRFPDEWLGGESRPDDAELEVAGGARLEHMIHGYTLGGAYPFRMEHEIGSIEIGKIADLVVLDKNVLEINRRAIHKIKPLMVILEGEIIQGELEMFTAP